MNDERLSVLLAKYRTGGDRETRDEVFELTMPLADAVAKRFMGRGVELDDLRQVAGIALLKAIERFDPALGYRFVTYAVPTITGEVRNYLRDRGSTMRIPRDARQKLYQMQQAQDAFRQRHLREPAAGELAEAMHIPLEELLSLLDVRNTTDMLSLDSPTGEDDDATLSQAVGMTDEGFARVEDEQWMRWVYSKLTETEKTLMTLRYRDRLGQRETARRMGVSQMQISRLERRMLTRLRAMEQA